LKEVFFVRGNADCHDPVASFRHIFIVRRVDR
jgi:hypothetical protein